MTTDKQEPSAEKIETLAKKIWLAGLGAYGQSLDNVQTGYDKLSEESLKVFEELVQKGESLQSEAACEVKDKVKESKNRIEARAEVLKSKLTLTPVLNSKLEKLSKKIDQLTNKLTKKS
jgi:DNA-binding protein H-NS